MRSRSAFRSPITRPAYRLPISSICRKNGLGTRPNTQAHVPENKAFQTKPEIALKQIKTALEAGVSAGVVLADAGYGVDAKFRSGLAVSATGR